MSKCIYIVEYYSARTKNEILPFPTTWMKFQDVRISEISKEKTYTAVHIIHVEF